MTPRIWVLSDGRAGNVNQVLGVAEQLGFPFDVKEVAYTPMVRLPNFLRGASTIGIAKKTCESLIEPYPDFVIGAGRRVFPLARYIKRQSGGKTKIIQMMNPGAVGFKEADLIVLPKHDCYQGNAQNVMQVVGAPHRVTAQKLAQEKSKWQAVLEKYPSPRVSVIVGGATKDAPFTLDMAQQLVDGVLALKPASILLTTSRRTPPEVAALLKEKLPKENTYFYQPADGGENPYFGLISWGDKIVVTGDSISMCSESCASGVPVFVFAPQGVFGKKHARFHEQLFKEGYAALLGSGQVAFGSALNAAKDVAQKIKSSFLDD